MGDKEKKRVGVTLTKLYLDAMDGLVRGGVYPRRSDLINDALRLLFKHYGIEPFSAEEFKEVKADAS